VYVDNDPMVLVHARALLANTTSEGLTTYVPADYHDPDLIVAEARKALDFDEPIAVMFMGVMGYEPDMDVVRSIVGTVSAATPSGSYLGCGTAPTPARRSSTAPSGWRRAAACRTSCAPRTSSPPASRA